MGQLPKHTVSDSTINIRINLLLYLNYLNVEANINDRSIAIGLRNHRYP